MLAAESDAAAPAETDAAEDSEFAAAAAAAEDAEAAAAAEAEDAEAAAEGDASGNQQKTKEWRRGLVATMEVGTSLVHCTKEDKKQRVGRRQVRWSWRMRSSQAWRRNSR